MAVTFWQTRATYGPYSAHVPTLGPHFPPITPSIAAPSQIEATHTHPPHRTALPIGDSAKKPGVFFGLLFQTGHCYTPLIPPQPSITKSIPDNSTADSKGTAAYNGDSGKWKHCHT